MVSLRSVLDDEDEMDSSIVVDRVVVVVVVVVGGGIEVVVVAATEATCVVLDSFIRFVLTVCLHGYVWLSSEIERESVPSE